MPSSKRASARRARIPLRSFGPSRPFPSCGCMGPSTTCSTGPPSSRPFTTPAAPSTCPRRSTPLWRGVLPCLAPSAGCGACAGPHSAGRKPHRRPALLQAQCLRGPSAGGILRASAVRRRDGERHDRLPRLCPQRAMLGREVSFPPFGERASDASVGAEPARSAVFRPTLRKMPEEMRGHCGWSRCPVLRAVSAGLVGRGWRTLRNMVAI